jgi:tripartite-type tricarboxylate transporter receptor subunit TctC
VPTFREQGFDIVAGSSRGIVGPPGLPNAIRSSLERTFQAVLGDPGFLRDAERVSLPLRPLVGPDYRRMVEQTDRAVQALWQQRPWSR